MHRLITNTALALPNFSTTGSLPLATQNSQSSSTELIAQLNLSRSVLLKKRSIGTLNFFEKTTVRRGSM